MAGTRIQVMTNGSLYSFWVSGSSNGASNGYVAANGPGFTTDTDTVGSSAGGSSGSKSGAGGSGANDDNGGGSTSDSGGCGFSGGSSDGRDAPLALLGGLVAVALRRRRRAS